MTRREFDKEAIRWLWFRREREEALELWLGEHWPWLESATADEIVRHLEIERFMAELSDRRVVDDRGPAAGSSAGLFNPQERNP